MRRLSAILISLLLAATRVFGQSSIAVEVPRAVAVDEQFNVTFTVNGEKPSSFEWAPSSDFKLVWGPQQGSSTSISMVNGKTTRTTTSSYTYVLMPTREGEFTIPAATAKVKGSTITSKPQTIKVAKGGASSASSTPNSSNAYSISSEDIFLRMEVSRRNVVLGEPITAKIKLYERVGVAGFEDVHFPSFDGFWNQVLESPTNVEFQRETVGDQIYNVALLRSFTLIPQRAGDLEIDPAEIVCLVRVRNRRASTGSIFDSFFQDEYTSVRKRLTTKPVTIHVGSLPQPQPESFCGGVGKFSVSSFLAKDSLSVHDASSLTVIVKGKGNLSLVEAPKVKFPADFEKYDVKITDKGDSRVFEYPFIPRYHGDFVIGPVEFSYYDTASGQYVTLTGEELPLKVARVEGMESAGPSQGQQFVGVAGRDVRNLGTDIRYIFTGKPGLHRAGHFFVFSPLFCLLAALLVLAGVAFLLAFRRAAERRADLAGQRRRGASKMARKRLSKAGEYMNHDLRTAYYEELHKALLGFVADKLGMDASEQDRQTISERLVAEGACEADAAAFVELLEVCEYARYSPDSTSDAMKTSYEKALRTVSALDDSLGRRKGGRGGAAAIVAALMMLIPSVADAQTDSLWRYGVDAYAAGQWDEAKRGWELIAEDGQVSAQLCYNLGCAYFKSGDVAHSILWFERALKLDPSYSDAKANLEYAESFTQDRIDSVPEFFLVKWVRGLRNSLSSDGWAVAFLVLLGCFMAMLVLFLLSRGAPRVVGFFAGLLFLMMASGSLGFSIASRAQSLDHSRLVVVSPVSVVRSAPDENSGTDLFVLHEGSRAKMLDEVGLWTKIELSDGRQGWIRKSDFEII